MKSPAGRALFSVDNLNEIAGFAIALKKMGWHIISTAETVEELQQYNIEVDDVSSFTGLNEKYTIPPTLHPKIEEALTMDVPYRIDLVYDIPYPIEKGKDVGGHTLLALGAKGNRIVVFSQEDMKVVIEELIQSENHKTISEDLRTQLIDKAYARITDYYLTLTRRNGESLYDGLIGKSILRLMNGENAYQVPADLFISEYQDDLSINPDLQNENVPCFTNLADTDCILNTLCLTAEAFQSKYKKVPYIAIAAKHGNPCGIGVNFQSPEDSILKALFGNPLAIWGGEFIVNFKVDEKLAWLVYKSEKKEKMLGNAHWMLDVIFAPDFDKKALEILGKRSSGKLLKNIALYEPKLPKFAWQYRQVRGGFLRQPPPDYVLDVAKTEHGTERLTEEMMDSLIIAWSVAYSSSHGGNEIALVKDGQLLGAGGGPSTVDAAKIAVLRARENGHNTTDSIFAADAFFPFTDAPGILKDAGCRAGAVPSGGKNEKLVRKFFRDNNIDVIYIPSQYRGFCRH
jgi:phosphoribosylaminoimidazolecarboxamide formyltransferase/IMP cyclohydrolase